MSGSTAASVLTVGVGEEYATIAAAIAASANGDVIKVSAGTYTNDFATINTQITLEGVGGVVNMVATEPLPNEKGILIVNNSATIQGFSFSGAEIPASEGNNGAAIRYQAGNLTLENDDFTGNQDGLLATPLVAGTGNIDIENSEFFNNGAGDGYSHNIYVNNVASLTFNNSYSHGAIVGIPGPVGAPILLDFRTGVGWSWPVPAGRARRRAHQRGVPDTAVGRIQELHLPGTPPGCGRQHGQHELYWRRWHHSGHHGERICGALCSRRDPSCRSGCHGRHHVRHRRRKRDGWDGAGNLRVPEPGGGCHGHDFRVQARNRPCGASARGDRSGRTHRRRLHHIWPQHRGAGGFRRRHGSPLSGLNGWGGDASPSIGFPQPGA